MKIRDRALCHHGILGTHWGVRRFQNQDGTRTVAGKKRYNTSKESVRKAEESVKLAKRVYKKTDDENDKIRLITAKENLKAEKAKIALNKETGEKTKFRSGLITKYKEKDEVNLLNDELYHHGVKGQKWGVRRYQNPDGTGIKGNSKAKGLSDRQKKAVKVGVAAAGVALAAVGTYHLAKSGQLDTVISSGRSFVNRQVNKNNARAAFNRMPSHKDSKQAHDRIRPEDLSNQELQDRVKRLNLENQYRKAGGGPKETGIGDVVKGAIGAAGTGMAAYNMFNQYRSAIEREQSRKKKKRSE